MLKKCPKKNPNVRTKLGLLGQNVEVNFSPAETLSTCDFIGDFM